MKLENQVTNLEISKRLKELGVNQESLFYWNNVKSDEGKDNWDLDKGARETIFGMDIDENISAFTVAELGEMLPNMIKAPEGTAWFETRTKGGGANKWMVAYDWDEDCFAEHADTEADARGKMLIYLKENKLV